MRPSGDEVRLQSQVVPRGAEAADCPLCGKRNGTVVFREGAYEGRRCSCGVIVTSPRPSRAEVKALYADDASHVSSRIQTRKSIYDRLHAHMVLRRIRQKGGRGRLVDVGAGGGGFLLEARRAGFDISAVELNTKNVVHMRALGIPTGDCLVGLYDVIYACDVLSHLYDPVNELSEWSSHLVKGGLLVLETGNLADVDQCYYPCLTGFQLPDHLFFFGVRSTVDLLQRSGVRTLSVSRFNLLPSLWLLGNVNRFRPGVGQATQGAEDSPNGASRQMVRGVFDLAHYAARYWVGGLLPKGPRPQTILVVGIAE